MCSSSRYFATVRRETAMPDMRAPYRKRREYNYGSVKLCLYDKEKQR